MSLTSKPFGYRVTIRRLGERAPHVFGVRTTFQSIARAQAEKKTRFLAVLRVEPLTETEFHQQFPPGAPKKRGPRFLYNHSV